MKDRSFEEIYQKVPEEQKEELITFRKNHNYEKVKFKGKIWKFIDNGKGDKNLLFLTGGTRIGEAYAILPYLEKEFRVISLTYPIINSIEEIIEGLNYIIKSKKIENTHIFGSSLGGVLAQEFIRKYPEKVEKIIIANTMPPVPESIKRGKFFIFLLNIMPTILVRRLTKKSLVRMWEEASEIEREFWLAYCEELIQNVLPKDWIIAQFKLSNDFATYNYTEEDLKIKKGKMLILNSKDDKTFDMELQRRLIKLYPEAEVYTFENAGHTPMVSNGEEYLRVVFNFLKKENI